MVVLVECLKLWILQLLLMHILLLSVVVEQEHLHKLPEETGVIRQDWGLKQLEEEEEGQDNRHLSITERMEVQEEVEHMVELVELER